MSYSQHRADAQIVQSIRCGVITVSDTRQKATDKSGTLMRNALEQQGCEVCFYRIIPDTPALIQALLSELAGQVDVVLLNGGTGISQRDNTYDTLHSLLEKEITGFGELFRMLSYHEIGAAAMLSRATAGVWQEMIIFSTPGSPHAVQLALDKLILPEIRHLLHDIRRQRP